MYLFGILCLVTATAALPVVPDPPTLTNSVAAAHQDSEIPIFNQHAATASTSFQDRKDNKQVKRCVFKIGSVIFPPPPLLQLFDYSILRKQKAAQKQKYEDTEKQQYENAKKEKVFVIPDEPVIVEVPSNPATLTAFVTALEDSEDRANIIHVGTDSASVADEKGDEEVKPNMAKNGSIVNPAPPELSVFDYSITEKQLADQKQKFEEALKQQAQKSKKVKEVVILDQENPDKDRVQPNSATLTSFVPVLEDSKGRVNILHVAADSASLAEEKDDEKVEHSMAKIATVVMPSPPELPPFDYSILRQQKSDYNLKSEYSAMQAAEKSKEEKEALIVDIEEPVKIKVPANPATMISSVTAAHDSEVSALAADKNDDEEVKSNMVKFSSIVIPAPPELSVFDYSIIEKQLADQKQKFEEALKQQAQKSKKVKEVIILDQENPDKVRVRPKSATLTSFVPVLEDSKGRVNILHVAADSASLAEEKDDEKVEHSMAKIATVVMPSPPELPPFDYSILRQQKSDYNLKSEYSAMQAAEKSKEEKEALIVDIEEPVKIKVPANPATLISSVTAAHDTEVSALVADKKDDEEVKSNMVKFASIVIPAPPELSVFDYSIIEKQLADQKQKFEEALKQEAQKSKKVKEVVILDQENPNKVRIQPNSATLTSFVPVLEDSKGRVNVLHVAADSASVAEEKDDEKVEHSMAKIATVVMPSPPELPPFDYSILRQQKSDYNLKSEYSAMQAAEKSKEEKEALIVDIKEPFKIKVPANPATMISSVTAAHDSEVSALAADKKDDEEVKSNMVKFSSIVIPAPPELSVFDYSIIEKQLADQKQKFEEALKQQAQKSKKVKEVVILDQENPDKVRVQPKSATLTSFVPVLEDSKGRVNILHVAADSASLAEEKDDEKVEHSMAKIATVVMPSPPELPPFDYSILRQQKSDYNLKSEYSAMQAAEKSKEEKEALIVDIEEPVKIKVPANPSTLISSVTAAHDSEVSALVADKKDDEEVKSNMVKFASIVIPAPPELSVFDYSIIEKQLADQKQKFEEALKQQAQKSKKVKEVVILDQENPNKVRIQPNSATLTSFVPVLEDSKGRVNILHVAADSASLAEEKDDEKVEHSMAKIATVVMPSPPELPPFDYSILRQQKSDYNLKSEYSAMQAAEKSKEEKEALIVDIKEPFKIKVPANPATIISSVTAAHDSEVSALAADKKDDEEVKSNMVKFASIVIPAPPELSVFDYSIIEKQLADQKQKFEEALKQQAQKSKKVKEVVILDQENPNKVRIQPNSATLTSFVPVLEDSKGRVNILHVAADSASVAEEKDDEKVEHSMAKIATVVIPSPPELPPFDYSILRQQKSDYNLKSEYSAMQAAEKSKEEKEALIVDIKEPFKTKVPANPATIISSVTAAHDSEVSALAADKKDDEEVKSNMVKFSSIVIPAPPELSVFDYSIIEKQLADQKQKFEEALKQQAQKSKKVKEVVILDQENPDKVRVQPNSATLTSFVPVLENSKGRVNILHVAADSASLAEEKDDEKVEHSMAKIATVVMPSPPELPPFDYSILRQQKSDYNLKSEYSAMQAAEKSKEEKEALIVDLEEPVKIKVPANPATLISSVTGAHGSEVSALVADKKDDEEVKSNMVKFASIVIPAPPELSVFDYSIIEKQLADQKQKFEEALKQQAQKSKKVKEVVILDQENPNKVRIQPNSATLTSFVPVLEDSKGRVNILHVAADSASLAEEKDDEEIEHNIAKIATVFIPSPPELSPFDYSILKKHKVDQKQKLDHFLKLEAEKSEKERDILIIEKPVKVKVPKLIEESQFVRDSKLIDESKPVEESKLIEVLKKEPVKHLEDIPVIIEWTITSAPLLRKLISNNPTLPSVGLKWPLQKPSKSGHSGIIYPKFDVDRFTYTN